MENNPCFGRGFVVESDERLWSPEIADNPPVVKVVPIDKDPRDPTNLLTIKVGPPVLPDYPQRLDIFPDPYPLVLRFKLGDRVVCKIHDGWAPATVLDTFLIWMTRLPVYWCTLDDDYYSNEGDELIAVPEDDDACIQRVTLTQDLRFRPGDAVTV